MSIGFWGTGVIDWKGKLRMQWKPGLCSVLIGGTSYFLGHSLQDVGLGDWGIWVNVIG